MLRPYFRLVSAALIAPIALVMAAAPAAAVTNLSFTFRQTGYAEGAEVTGAFAGADLDGNGLLVHFPETGGPPIAHNELTAWSMHFSGNSLAPAFDLTLEDLYGFVYQLGTAGIGDDPAHDPTIDQDLIEGIGAIGESHFYSAGLGPNSFIGAYVGGEITGPGEVEDHALDSTQNLALVTAVPEPAAATLLLAAGLALAAAARRATAG